MTGNTRHARTARPSRREVPPTVPCQMENRHAGGRDAMLPACSREQARSSRRTLHLASERVCCSVNVSASALPCSRPRPEWWQMRQSGQGVWRTHRASEGQTHERVGVGSGPRDAPLCLKPPKGAPVRSVCWLTHTVPASSRPASLRAAGAPLGTSSGRVGRVGRRCRFGRWRHSLPLLTSFDQTLPPSP